MRKDGMHRSRFLVPHPAISLGVTPRCTPSMYSTVQPHDVSHDATPRYDSTVRNPSIRPRDATPRCNPTMRLCRLDAAKLHRGHLFHAALPPGCGITAPGTAHDAVMPRVRYKTAPRIPVRCSYAARLRQRCTEACADSVSVVPLCTAPEEMAPNNVHSCTAVHERTLFGE